MWHFLNRAAHRRRVRPLNDLIQFPQAQTANDAFLGLGKGDPAPVILDPNLSRRGFLLSLFLRSHMLCRFTGLLPVCRAGAPLQTDLSS